MKELAKRDLCVALERDSNPNQREQRISMLVEKVKIALQVGVDFTLSLQPLPHRPCAPRR